MEYLQLGEIVWAKCRVIEEDGGLYLQPVSQTPWTRDDLDTALTRVAELAGENKKLRGIATTLNAIAVPKPLSADREAIVEAVERWINKNDVDATADMIARAVLEAAVKAGGVEEPQADNTRLRGEAREALEPFAHDATFYADVTPDAVRLSAGDSIVTVGDLRRAARVHAALSGGEADKGEA